MEKLAAGHWNVVDGSGGCCCGARLINKSSPTIAAGAANVNVDGVIYDADVDDEPFIVRTLPPIKSVVCSCVQLCPVPVLP